MDVDSSLSHSALLAAPLYAVLTLSADSSELYRLAIHGPTPEGSCQAVSLFQLLVEIGWLETEREHLLM